MGIVGIALAVVLLGVLVATGAPRLARLGLFLPLVVGAFGVFQARART